MTKTIKIDNCNIGDGFKPYIIAEMSANHNQNINTALAIIEKAKAMGADAVKIQTYTPDTLTIASDLPDFKINDGLWAGQTLYDLYQSAYTPWEWHEALFDKARKVGITLFSSPFDKTAIDLLEDLNTPAYKIASFEAIDLPLIKYAAATKKPLIISTGMANIEEITEAVEIAQENGCQQLALLHCVSGYPAPAGDYNLQTICDMAGRFNLVTGISDHTLDNTTAITSVALGSAIIEKHFTLDRNGGGPDDSFSMEPNDLLALCRDTKTAWSALGEVNYDRKPSEKSNLKFRRSLYFVKNISAGEIISENHIKSIRPGYGLQPKHIEKIIGKKVIRNVVRGTATTWDLIE